MKTKTAKTAKTTKTASHPSTTTPASTGLITTNAGLAALVSELTALLDTAEARLGPAPAITTTQKRRTGKPRKGGDKALAMLAPIVQQHNLESPSLNTTDMLELNQKAQTLVPLQTRLVKVTKRVGDEAFNAQTQAWDMGLQLYSLVRRRAKSDGDLAANLEPVSKMFAYRTPAVKASKPAKVETRAKSNLEKAVALATKHGVPIPAAPGAGSATPQGTTSAASSASPVSVSTTPAAVPAPAAVTSAGTANAGGTGASSPPTPVTNGAGGASH